MTQGYSWNYDLKTTALNFSKQMIDLLFQNVYGISGKDLTWNGVERQVLSKCEKELLEMFLEVVSESFSFCMSKKKYVIDQELAEFPA